MYITYYFYFFYKIENYPQMKDFLKLYFQLTSLECLHEKEIFARIKIIFLQS
nr:hypothetical protein GTC16762_13770 [Pigmentibacter ruber]